MPTQPFTAVRYLSTEECWQRLAAHPARVGRVGVGGASPDIFPVNYVLDGHSIVFRTAPGKKLAAVGRGERVVFEVDDIDATWHCGWSVVLRGFAQHVTDPAERAGLEQLPLRTWDRAPKPEFVRIRTHLVSGREITEGGLS
ncbi:MAG TPA: pyridoxamine 5'-phosphate oxidase family protein [Euzebyales bacterium]|nr:pyridoxamine 5'-phosphate oxidase family protein [Euzebyales bacterium]